MSSHRGKWVGGVPRRARPAPRSCRQGPRPSGEADLRLRRTVAGVRPSGRLMGLRLRPALLLPAGRLGVRQPFNEAGLTGRDAVERSPLIV
jgi:hypothetical protein